MKIGVIPNLVSINNFVQTKMALATPEEWMVATGGNTGNVAFVQGILNILGDNVEIIHWGDNPKTINSTYDHIVVCCANQLGAHVDLLGWAKRLTDFDLPVTLIGIGAQADEIGQIPELPEGTLELLKVTESLKRHKDSQNIITRGDFSSKVTSHYGYNSSPFGCPSQFISPERGLGELCFKRQNSRKYNRIMTAAGNPWHQSAVLENTLVQIVKDFSGEYILQHPKALFQLAQGDLNELTMGQKKRIEEIYSSLGTISEISDWFSAYGTYYADAQNWMHHAKRYSLALGPRYHGIALPIQTGVPGKVIFIDSRTEELSLTTGVPCVNYNKVSKLSAKELVDQCFWTKDDAINYDEIRSKNAEKYLTAIKSNGISASQHLTNLSED